MKKIKDQKHPTPCGRFFFKLYILLINYIKIYIFNIFIKNTLKMHKKINLKK